MKISEHFILSEFTASTLAARWRIDNAPPPAAVDRLTALARAVLEPWREKLAGNKIIITSGYRSPKLNRLVGGAPRSQHVLGEAADCQTPGVPLLRAYVELLRCGAPIDQAILEDYKPDIESGWIHVSHAYTCQQRTEFFFSRVVGRLVKRRVYHPVDTTQDIYKQFNEFMRMYR